MTTSNRLSLREEASLRASAMQREDDQEDPEYTSASASQSHPLEGSASLASSARKEWRQHGVGVIQALEEKRRAAESNPSNLVVRVISAQKRVDVSGSEYTAYVIRVIHQGVESLVEHRYSAFSKLQSLLKKNNVTLDAAFPPKHLAGRLGNWTPSKSWAPEQHEELISYRIIQLDVWLVDLAEKYNNHELPEGVATALYEFLTAPEKPPCDQINDMETDNKWAWNNPLSFTLGSAIRQATHTVQYMSSNVLSESDQSIPLDLLQSAKGLCFMTVFKAGMVVSGRVGTGLVVARLDNDQWSAVTAVGTIGMGWGALIGGDVTHYLVVLTTEKAVQDCVASSSVQLGAELGVAVGPVGRGANSHLRTGDWTLHPAYAYAYSQGFFVGMSLEGSVVTIRSDVNDKFYGRKCDARELLKERGPKAAEPLYEALNKAMQLKIPEGSFRPSQYLSPKSDTKSNNETPSSNGTESK